MTPAIARVARQIFKHALLATLPRRMLIAAGDRHEQTLGLTFDDGPHPEVTPRVLDALAAASVRATFFVIGQRARKYPQLVERIVREGHTLGNHTYYHHPPVRTSAPRLMREVYKTAAVLEQFAKPVKLFRPPLGRVSAGKLGRLWHARQTVVLWSYDPLDCRRRSADELCERFVRKPPRAGDLVLLHDVRPQTAEALPQLLSCLRQQGFCFRTVDEYLSCALHCG